MIGVGPVVTASGNRAPSDPHFDPFWSRVNEAGVTLGWREDIGDRGVAIGYEMLARFGLAERARERAEKVPVSRTRLGRQEHDRRPGDPPILIAAADRIQKVLGWIPRYDDLGLIVKTSLDWEKSRSY